MKQTATRLTSFLFLLLVVSIGVSAQRVFNHPGGILSSTDLERIKQHVDAGDEPWASCWKDLQSYSLAQNTYTAKPSAEIGGGGTRQRAASDGYAAMLNAIEWHITGNTAYADCAARILTAWGETLETASAELYQYPCRNMIMAAEMLRNSDGSFYEGWAENDRNTFLTKVRTVMYPAAKKFCTYMNSHPSWYTPATLVVMASGVLLDDAAIYQEGYDLMLNTDHWGQMYGGSIEPSGQMREMGRDNVHGGLTLGDITQACLLAWNQGDDLFAAGDNRLLKGVEYWCRYNTGHPDTPFEPLDCSGLDNSTGFSFYYISMHNNGFRLRPDACCFEAVYHHYKEVKGMDDEKEFPYLTIAARLARPDTANELLGFGTLFFTIDAKTSPYMTEEPAKPQDFRAEDGYKCIYVSWKHPENEDARGFNLYRSTDGKSFSLLKTWDYYTNNIYKDEDVEPGKTYYYKLRLINRAGGSLMSEISSATAQPGTDELPGKWNFAGISSGSYGGGMFTAAQDSTFAVSGLGKDIGGTSDMLGYVYKKVTGDATLTVRLTSTKEAFYKVGVMMRGTLDSRGQSAGLTLGETGYRMVRMFYRTSVVNSTSWINGTNYGYAPMWMRVKREGNKFSTYISRDGDTWYLIGSTTMYMPKTYYVGMASCNGQTSGETYEAIFDHVSLEAEDAAPENVPTAPRGLTAIWTDSCTASLSWQSVEDADSFIVYRSTDNVNFDSIATVSAFKLEDKVTLPGKYFYSVAAFNTLGMGELCDAVEIELYDAEQLSGTVIGTEGSWNNNPSTTRSAALDNNIGTFFDALEADGAWVGYDMGEKGSAMVAFVKFAPRNGYPERMTGGEFQAATTADFSDAWTIAKVDEEPAEGVLTKLTAPSRRYYRYLRYISPDGGNCNVAEVQFFGHKKTDDTDAITDVTVSPEEKDGDVFSINGIKVNKTEKGHIYIKSGKKFYQN